MNVENKSTIVALSTPGGFGGIAIVRLSGDKSLEIIQKLFKSKQQLRHRLAVFGRLYDKDGYIDTAIVTYFKAPNSYTGEDLIEISLHGSPFLCDLIITACKKEGARGAAPGEFTQRAFLNGKMDLSQAEGVADIIYSASRSAQTASASLLEGRVGETISKIKSAVVDIISVLELELDFQEEEIQITPKDDIIKKINTVSAKIAALINSYDYGKIIREGVICPIIGPPNSGKSSLFNAFLKEERVIVSPSPGTTRDFIEESIRVSDYQFRLIDTAGIRDTYDAVESAGVSKSKDLVNKGNVILYVIDISDTNANVLPLSDKIFEKVIYILNKSDLATPQMINNLKKQFAGQQHYFCSAKYLTGIHEIASGMVKKIELLRQESESVFITRLRHKEALDMARKSLMNSIDSTIADNPSEIIVIDLREALNHLNTILGKTTNEDILNNIFSHFCIGK
jgi:tRNA modification GTPase